MIRLTPRGISPSLLFHGARVGPAIFPPLMLISREKVNHHSCSSCMRQVCLTGDSYNYMIEVLQPPSGMLLCPKGESCSE